MLQAAIWSLNAAVIGRVLDAGADIEARDFNNLTPLLQAIHAEIDEQRPLTGEITRLLVERGADVLALTWGDSGSNAAEIAEEYGHTIAAQMLRDRMAELEGEIETADGPLGIRDTPPDTGS